MKKRHPAAVREWAIQQIMLPIGRSMTEVASELGVTTEALRLWRRAFLSQLDPDNDARQRHCHGTSGLRRRRRRPLVVTNPDGSATLPRFGNGR
jgi:transposase-like protein